MASIVTPCIIGQLPGHNRNERQIADVENNFIPSCKHVQTTEQCVINLLLCAAVHVIKLILKHPKVGFSPKLGQLTVLSKKKIS